MDSDIEEKLNSPHSWIPIKAIKKIMGFRESPIEKNRSKLSINSETGENTDFFSGPNEYSLTSQDKKQRKVDEDYVKVLESKLKASQTERKLLKSKLQKTEQDNFVLQNELKKVRQGCMIKIQMIQESHERKLQKTKKDLDYLLKEMNNQSSLIILEDFMRIHNLEMEKCREEYEGVFKRFLKKKCKGCKLEQKVQNELDYLRDKYVESIQKLKNSLISGSIDEDNLSTGLNSERVTSEMKRNSLETTLKVQFSCPKLRVNKLT